MMNFRRMAMVAVAEMVLPGIGGAIVNTVNTVKDAKKIAVEINEMLDENVEEVVVGEVVEEDVEDVEDVENWEKEDEWMRSIIKKEMA